MLIKNIGGKYLLKTSSIITVDMTGNAIYISESYKCLNKRGRGHTFYKFQMYRSNIKACETRVFTMSALEGASDSQIALSSYTIDTPSFL